MILENTKRIEVSPAVVWATTIDVENWPQWTPTVTQAIRLDDGPFAVGSITRLSQPGLPVSNWQVTELQDGVRFTWESRVRGMFMSATHEVLPDQAGTRNTLRLKITGLTATLLWPVIRKSVQHSLELENSGLKQHCESVPPNELPVHLS